MMIKMRIKKEKKEGNPISGGDGKKRLKNRADLLWSLNKLEKIDPLIGLRRQTADEKN